MYYNTKYNTEFTYWDVRGEREQKRNSTVSRDFDKKISRGKLTRLSFFDSRASFIAFLSCRSLIVMLWYSIRIENCFRCNEEKDGFLRLCKNDNLTLAFSKLKIYM